MKHTGTFEREWFVLGGMCLYDLYLNLWFKLMQSFYGQRCSSHAKPYRYYNKIKNTNN